MRIVFVYHTSIVGGGSYCLLNILREIDRSRFQPVVLLKDYGPLVDEIKKLGIEVFLLDNMHVVPYNESTLTPRKIVNAIEIIASFRRFKQIIRQTKPDIVYINSMMLYPYLRIAKQEGIKTLIHIREHWPENEHKWQRRLAINHISRFADKIVAINSYSLSMLSDAKQPKTIVYDWIDLSERSKPQPLEGVFNEELSDKRVYLYMGGLQAIKGAIEVLDLFTKDISDENARLLVMGVNPQMMTGGIKGIIKDWLAKLGYKTYSKKVLDLINTDRRIKCIPGTYDVKNIYEQTYCILSYFRIPHANLALAESIIAGTVNVAASTPESIEYSHNGQLALLYEINNREAFRETVLGVNEHYDELKNIITVDSHYVEEMFDKEANVKKLNEFLTF